MRTWSRFKSILGCYLAITAKSGWILSNMCLSKQLWQRFS